MSVHFTDGPFANRADISSSSNDGINFSDLVQTFGGPLDFQRLFVEPSSTQCSYQEIMETIPDLIVASGKDVHGLGDNPKDRERASAINAVGILATNLDALIEGRTRFNPFLQKRTHEFGHVAITKTAIGKYDLDLYGSIIQINPDMTVESLSPWISMVSVEKLGGEQVMITMKNDGAGGGTRKYIIAKDSVTRLACVVAEPGRTPYTVPAAEHPSHGNWIRERTDSGCAYFNVRPNVPVTVNGGSEVTSKKGQIIVSNKNEGKWTFNLDVGDGNGSVTFQDKDGNITTYQRPQKSLPSGERCDFSGNQNLSGGLSVCWGGNVLRIKMANGYEVSVLAGDSLNLKHLYKQGDVGVSIYVYDPKREGEK